MYYDHILWDLEGDPEGNVEHIAEHAVTPDEVEEIIDNHEGPIQTSRSSGNSIIFGWTSTGKHLAVVFALEDDEDLTIVRPITAYPTPERKR